MKLTRVSAGWYATPDGRFAVIGDDPDSGVTKDEADGAGVEAGMSTQREWQVVEDAQGRLREDHHAGTTLAWVDRLSEGKDHLRRMGVIE